MSAVDILHSTSSLHQPWTNNQQYQSNSNSNTNTNTNTNSNSHSPPKSPVAPSYSPITPKASIVLPVPSQSAFVRPPDNNDFTFSNKMPGQHAPQPDLPDTKLNAPSSNAHFIPQPPNLPFSADDSSDAIALRAAISTLQYQKQKAQGDLKALESMKKLALNDPEHFTAELKAGRLREVKPKVMSSMRPLNDDEDEDSEEEGDEEGQAVLGAVRQDEEGTAAQKKSISPPPRLEIPDSQPSQTSTLPSKPHPNTSTKFPKIPGPQEVIRTPYINWAKYGIVGAPLNSMHAQQQKWPGTANFTNSKGREYSVAAPYSPFLDELEGRGQGDSRRDSGPQPSLTGTISEHVMSTRSRN